MPSVWVHSNSVTKYFTFLPVTVTHKINISTNKNFVRVYVWVNVRRNFRIWFYVKQLNLIGVFSVKNYPMGIGYMA